MLDDISFERTNIALKMVRRTMLDDISFERPNIALKMIRRTMLDDISFERTKIVLKIVRRTMLDIGHECVFYLECEQNVLDLYTAVNKANIT